ncbi:MAG: type II toxin-antitoxin system RelE/ParE family toxin [Coriobacteriales bacterium]|jgi:mRNA interferase RelE/StbE|nr:type II toxin-antitoxin system RelE/ParE family toxin [Coriobacteriales bacterium]
MSYTVIIKKRAEKEIARLDKMNQAIIAHWILENLEGCENPRAVPQGKKLETVKNGWRWRIGVYRLLGTINDSQVTIELFRVGHRREVYRGLPR